MRLDEEGQGELARADPRQVLQQPPPVLLDEWQRVPQLWDAVRRAVDDGAPSGQFLLTGSATPPQGLEDPPRHSGAARIDVLRMRPMTLVERLDTGSVISLSDLLTESDLSIEGHSTFSLPDYVREIVMSGFPGLRKYEGRAHRTRLDGYISRIIDRDFEDEFGQEVRRPEALRRWLMAYAAATASPTSLEKVRKAAFPGESGVAQSTLTRYRDVLMRLFILDPIDGWSPSGNILKGLGQSPKHHLADPALAARLLGLTESRLLSGKIGSISIPGTDPILGALFESLVALSVRVFAQAAEARTFHFRRRDGRREVDFIVESSSGEIVALEVKLASEVTDKDCRHLNWLQNELGDRVRQKVVVSTGPYAYRRRDGVAVIPLALLGP